GHLARHNRIHTGERNFSCLMPGCPSRFSRQDNMMQHYRTHISPKSRRGIPKKRDYFMLDHTANHSQDGLAVFHGGMGHREQSPAGDHGKHHTHIAKMGSLSRHGSRQNSPPRFNPFDRSSSVDYTARNSTESHNGGGSLRHKNSGIIQTHQHHTPLPHFNVHAHALGMAHPHPQPHQSARAVSVQGSLPSPLTPTMSQPQSYQHPSYSSRQHEQHHSSSYGSEHSYNQDAMLVSPTSPPTQDVERMDGVSSAQERQGYYTPHPYSQQKSQYPTQHQSHYPNAHHSSSLPHQAHAGRAHQNGYQLPPLSLESQERQGQISSERSSSGSLFHPQKQHNSTPPSPQSTPHTPTRYRFDPIQDCLQQDKQHRQKPREQYEEHTDHHSRFQAQYHDAAAEQEDTSMATTNRSSAMSSAASMSSISSSSSSSRQGQPSQPHRQQQEPKRETTEEMSGLAHLAQIVTTYG
ncbi:transcriptional repressor, partial [Mortierella alpina]